MLFFFVRLVDIPLRKQEVAFEVCGKGRGIMLISVVEDNPAVLSLIETALALHGHSVETYSNLTSFLSALQKSKRIPPYDLVLVDLFLENQSGIDLIEALRVQSRQAPRPHPQMIPTILISAAEENVLGPIRQRYPHLPILRKPFKMQELISLIDKVTSS